MTLLRNKLARYLLVMALVVAVIHAAVGYLNYLVDPFWFFGGNKLQARNFTFDERMARLAHFVTSERDHDCYVFGASRVAMMNHHNIPGYKCFMVSFANATPGELLAYAEYMKARAKREPRLVIVGVDDFSFVESEQLEGQVGLLNLPEPIVDNRRPYFWQYYLSADVARWSVETLLDASPRPRYYGGDLTGRIEENAEGLQVLELDIEPGEFRITTDVVSEYARFRELFPEARLVAYATPVAADQIVEYHDSGLLPAYVNALHETSAHFDEMYDFSIPSHITTNPELTYDGSHYEPWVSEEISVAIQNRAPGFGIVISGRNVQEIMRLYAQRMRHLVARAGSPSGVSPSP